MISSASSAPKPLERMNSVSRKALLFSEFTRLFSPFKCATSTSNFLVLGVWRAQLQGAGLYACLHEAQRKLSSILLLFEDIKRLFSILNMHSNPETIL